MAVRGRQLPPIVSHVFAVADSYVKRSMWSTDDQNRLRHLFTFLAKRGLTGTAPKTAIRHWMKTTPVDEALDEELHRSVKAICTQIISIDEKMKAGIFRFDWSGDDYELHWDPVNKVYKISLKN